MIDFKPQRQLETDSGGELVIRMTGAEVRQRKPLTYQEINGARRAVPCRYSIRDQAVGFDVGPYDHAKPLTIDPVLGYSTYFGGGGTDEGNSIAVDSGGNIYIAGFTDSLDFPLRRAAQPDLGGGPQDAFVAKLDPTGTRLLYSTYIGGDGQDNATGIAVDAAGNAFITGFTGSTNFPVRNPMGITDSSNFPIANPIQAMNAGGAADLFIAKIDATPFVTGAMPDGKRLIVSGSGFDEGAKIFIDGEKQKTANDSQNPGEVLIGKTAAKAVKAGATVTLQVRNADGSLSNEFRYTRP